MNEKLSVINGLRGWAILIVMFGHLFGAYFDPSSPISVLAPQSMSPLRLLSFGGLGVPLFFIVSGFVLFLPYVMGKRRMDTREALTTYYVRRAARLLPLYYLVVIVCLLFNQNPDLTDPKFFKQLIGALTAGYCFSNHGFEPFINGPLWSLSVEVWFSVLFPLFVVVAARYGVARLLIATIVISLASRLIGGMVLATESDGPFLPLAKGLPAHLDEFAIGMVLASLYHHGHLARYADRAGPAAAGGILLILVAVCWQGYVPLAQVVPVFQSTYQIGLFLLVAGLLAAPAMPGAWAFTNRPIQIMGMMCYSLYLWHVPLRTPVFHALYAPMTHLAVTLPVYLFLVTAIAGLSYRYIEFGRTADWRPLFLMRKGRPVAAPSVAATLPQVERPA
ncbi:MAG TPA: acyltransferase [Aliidongia sp.]|uniref:acyltransferase family protein n=1 Tax=Aliidongia sp. TaxID=1914230 RepID=UPI002DDD1235|nr:acyltransferase [Aliidongia sp.]HEV2678752.1 acyltransferase [Aliidongia sp.]